METLGFWGDLRVGERPGLPGSAHSAVLLLIPLLKNLYYSTQHEFKVRNQPNRATSVVQTSPCHVTSRVFGSSFVFGGSGAFPEHSLCCWGRPGQSRGALSPPSTVPATKHAEMTLTSQPGTFVAAQEESSPRCLSEVTFGMCRSLCLPRVSIVDWPLFAKKRLIFCVLLLHGALSKEAERNRVKL